MLHTLAEPVQESTPLHKWSPHKQYFPAFTLNSIMPNPLTETHLSILSSKCTRQGKRVQIFRSFFINLHPDLEVLHVHPQVWEIR